MIDNEKRVRTALALIRIHDCLYQRNIRIKEPIQQPITNPTTNNQSMISSTSLATPIVSAVPSTTVVVASHTVVVASHPVVVASSNNDWCEDDFYVIN